MKKLFCILLVAISFFVFYVATPAATLAEEQRIEESVAVYAEANQFSLDTALEYSPIMGELDGLREESVKHFRRADGVVEAVVYPYPVHYEENGQWKDIDNTLVPVTDETGKTVGYQTKSGLDITFGTALSDDRLVQYAYGDQSLSWRFSELTSDRVTVNSADTSKQTDMERDMAMRFPETLSSEIVYEDEESGLSVRYVLTSYTLTEYITLVERPTEAVEYELELTVEGMTPQQNADGRLTFLNEKEEVCFEMGLPVMDDSNGLHSDSFEVTLEEIAEQPVSRSIGGTSDTRTYRYTIAPDMDFLTSAETAYPVVIDPDVKPTFRKTVEDTYISPSSTSANYSDRDRLNATLNGNQILLKMPNDGLPLLNSGDVILEATLNLSRYNSNASYTNCYLRCYPITSEWDTETVTWNTMPDYDDSRVASLGVSSQPDMFTAFDITKQVKEWYLTPESNHGFMIVAENSTTVFRSSEYNESYSGHPYFSLFYVNSTGLENTWTYFSQSAGRAGTGSVNAFSGNLTWTHADASIANGVLPIALSHAYNTNDQDTDLGYGNGWRLNYAQSIALVEMENRTETAEYFQWIDGDGTRHYYKENTDNALDADYVNELDRNSVLNVETDTVTIEDKGHQKLVFAYSDTEKIGRLLRMEDANGNKTLISYLNSDLSDLRISSVQEQLNGQAAGQSLTLGYTNGLLTSVTSPDGLNTAYAYTNGDLTEITYTDSKSVSYTYNAAHCLTEAENIDGYRLVYTYTEEEPCRVLRVTEYADTTEGQHLSFGYTREHTTVTDTQGRETTYLWDHLGQPVCVTDSQGRAVYAAYNTAEQTVTQLSAVSKMQNTVINLLENHGFEQSSSQPTGWTRSNTSKITINSSNRHAGRRSVAFVGTTSADLTLSDTVSVEEGETYTFSGYFSSASVDSAYLRVTDGTETYLSSPVETNGTAGTDWQRGSVTFTAATDSVTVAVVMPKGSGTLYVDSVQLEQGAAPNRYNLLTNGDFTNGTTDYTVNYTAKNGVVDLSTTDAQVFATHPDGLNSSVCKLAQTRETNTVSQTLSVAGTAGDTYSFGGWLQCSDYPQTSQRLYYLSNGTYHTHMVNLGIRKITLEFINSSDAVNGSSTVYFSSDTSEWQFACGSATAPYNYSKIRLTVTYFRGRGEAYVDGLQVYKEPFSQAYEYDEQGNLTGYASLIGQQNSFDYDDNDNLTSATDAKGNETTYTYYDATANDAVNDNPHLLESVTTEEGVTTSYTYNEKGQTTTTKVGDNSTFIQSTTAYDPATALATAVTDARGNSVETIYHAAKRYVTEVRDAKDAATTYQYDNLNRVNYISSEIDAVSSASIAYTYTDDRLTFVSVNDTTEYTLTYDEFGRSLATVAGSAWRGTSTTLSTNAYDEYGKLDRTTYGNGFVVSYVYDSLDRVIAVKFNDTVAYRYTYNGEGDLYSAQDVALGYTIYYEYDHAGRCMASTTKSDSTGAVLASYSYEYDLNNNLSKLTCTTNGTTWATTYTYDGDNRPTATTLANGMTVTNTYDALGRITRKRLAINSNYDTTYTYLAGANNSQTALLASYQNGGDTAYTYTYDENGNITSISQGGSTTYYTYDRLNELIREDNATLNQSWTYTYDVNGNLLNKKRYAYVPNGGTLGACLETISYGYDAAHQDWADQLTSYNSETIRYDDSGNPISYRGYTMAWQGRHLTSATKTGTAISYSYDENGIRTQKSVNGVATNYYYNGSLLISMTQGTDTLLFSYDASGSVVSVNFNGTEYYYVRNGQGDVVKLIDGNGTTVTEYTYDTWGKLLTCTGSLSATLGTINPFGYRGYVYDNETGFYYLQSRYYDPEVGRFLSADVLLSTGQGVLGHNTFAYCLNNPVNGSDPSGKAGNIYRTWVETYTGRNTPIKGLERKPDKYYLQDIYYDDEYDWADATYSIGQSVSYNAKGVGVTAGVLYARDTQGNSGFYRYRGLTAGISGSSCTTDFTRYSCPSVENLEGLAFGYGASGSCQFGFGAGGETTYFHDKSTNKWYDATTFTTGLGTPGFEAHGVVTYTECIIQWDKSGRIVKWFGE